MWGVKGHMHRVREKLIRPSTTWMMKTQNRTRQSNITVNSTTSHLPHFPFLLLNTLNKEFSATYYCDTLYKDISIASPWGPWVLSWDWKTWIWSQSSSRAVVVDPRLSAAYQSAYCRVFCEYLGVFVTQKSSYTQNCSFGLSYCCGAVIFIFFSIEDHFRFRVVLVHHLSHLLPSPNQCGKSRAVSFGECSSKVSSS